MSFSHILFLVLEIDFIISRRVPIRQTQNIPLIYTAGVTMTGGSNYDSLIVRTVAFPVQVAYWIKRS